MSSRVSRTQEYANRTLGAGELAAALKSVVELHAVDLHVVQFSLAEELPDGSKSYKRNLAAADLGTVCDLRKINLETTYDTDSGEHVTLSVFGMAGDRVAISVSAADGAVVQQTMTALQAALALEATESVMEELKRVVTTKRAGLLDLAERIEALEVAVLSPARRLRCFLSYRFSSESEITALRIQQFLNLIDVDVLTGASYEPRTIQEKVLSRLREDLDFLILLVTKTGESMWTRDEIASALHRGVAVVPLVEEGVDFQKGLFGDIEYISYSEGHIGDSFIKLLEAVRFIRSQRDSGGSQKRNG